MPWSRAVRSGVGTYVPEDLTPVSHSQLKLHIIHMCPILLCLYLHHICFVLVRPLSKPSRVRIGYGSIKQCSLTSATTISTYLHIKTESTTPLQPLFQQINSFSEVRIRRNASVIFITLINGQIKTKVKVQNKHLYLSRSFMGDTYQTEPKRVQTVKVNIPNGLGKGS